MCGIIYGWDQQPDFSATSETKQPTEVAQYFLEAFDDEHSEQSEATTKRKLDNSEKEEKPQLKDREVDVSEVDVEAQCETEDEAQPDHESMKHDT